MFFKNPNLKRENPFRKVYDNPEFREVLQRKDRLPDFPFLVDIELTNYCNLKCIFCGQQAMQRAKGFMPEDVLKKVLDECSKFSTPVRFIRWGEPFLHPKIIDFCKYAKSKGLPLHITTNGIDIKENQMEHLVELGIDSLIFSFQGTTKEQYEIMRNNRLYGRLKGNISKIVSLRGDREKPYIHISTTVTNESKGEIDKFLNYWGNIVDSVGVGKTNLSLLSTHRIKNFKTAGKLESLKKQETIKKYYRPCAEVYQKISVDWDGKVTCCCCDFNNFLVIGTLNQATIYDIWNSSKELKIFRELLDKGLHGSLALCRTCYPTYDEF